MFIKTLSVLGSPIEHSKSPLIHMAAYSVLGLEWDYQRNEVRKGGLRSFVEGLDDSWLGLSLTMPLKEEATKLAVSVDKAAEATGAVNTLVRSESGWLGFNTDVFGIVQAVHNANLGQLNRVLIIGSGATATSAMVAIKQLAPSAEVIFLARNSRTRDRLILAAKALGLKAKKSGSLKRAIKKSDLTIATLPGGALDAEAVKLNKARGLKPSGALLDVAYQPWPSAFAQLWLANNKPIISGLEMLLWQAVAQIRIFTTGDPALPLPNEVAVVEAMRHSLEQ